MKKSGFELTKEDFEKARRLYEKERIYPINRETIFLGAIYCIIFQADNYKKARKIYESLILTLKPMSSHISF